MLVKVYHRCCRLQTYTLHWSGNARLAFALCMRQACASAPDPLGIQEYRPGGGSWGASRPSHVFFFFRPNPALPPSTLPTPGPSLRLAS